MPSETDAYEVAKSVTDPELPMVTLDDLGILREVSIEDSSVVVTITPTYSGCPAMGAMRDDLTSALHAAGYKQVEIRTVLSPPWSSTWITEAGKRKLADAGIAPPTQEERSIKGPIPLALHPSMRTVHCPNCASAATTLISECGGTACKSLRRCNSCFEPFEHFKEI